MVKGIHVLDGSEDETFEFTILEDPGNPVCDSGPLSLPVLYGRYLAVLGAAGTPPIPADLPESTA